MYTKKQNEILNYVMNNDYHMLINHGAKRTGKTVLNNDLFLMELRRVGKIAKEQGIDNPQYILAGASLGTIMKNVLIEITNKYGLEFKFDKFNRFKLFGVLVVCTGHSTIAGIAAIRGMTSFGAYINEGSLANEEVFDEIKARCSGDGARILVDSNPDHPEHWLLKDYIENESEMIVDYHFELDDNTFLSERYKNNIKSSTPSGMFYDRGIKGLWISGDGVVYSDFNKDIHFITREQLENVTLTSYFAGVDWGYQHFGSIIVIGADAEKNYYMIEEYSDQHKEIDHWVTIAKGIKKRYGNINFYADSARPEHVMRFRREGLRAINANKSVLAGIEEVARLIKLNRFFVVYDVATRFREEIYKYIWDEKSGMPKKENDDVLDSIRYAIISHTRPQRRKDKK
jgi:PBSX family phage terminase large subunit